MKQLKFLPLYFVALFVLYSCNPSYVETTSKKLDQILSEFHNPSSKKVLNAAHRAMHTNFPENSLAAIQHSIESGVDIIEIDIRTTKDGRLVLMHDETIDRTTNGKGELNKLSFVELSKLELNKKANDHNNYKVPLAEDALNLAFNNIMVDLDIKDVSVKLLVDLVHKTHTEKQVVFFDSDYSVLDSVLLMDSTLMIMPRAYTLKDVKKIISKYSPPVIHIDPSFYNYEVASTIKNSGARIWINALGNADEKASNGFIEKGFTPLLEFGANIIQTDLPVTLNKFLEQKKIK